MEILNSIQINHKIKRLATEIAERNLEAKQLIFLGINNNGYRFAELLKEAVPSEYNGEIKLSRLRLNPAAPLDEEIEIEGLTSKQINNNPIIIIDDVANTGRTLFYALKPLMNESPRTVQFAVLVDRKHKSFPIVPDYIGLALATTLKDNIKVNISGSKQRTVNLI